MLGRVLVVFGSLLMATAVGLPLIEERIFGGTGTVSASGFAAIESLERGGSIISNRLVVTTAHSYITSYPNVSDYRVVVGATMDRPTT